MSLEDKIQELETKLALKKAYLSVTVGFGKAHRAIPDAIKQQVSDTVTELCAKLANDEEISSEPVQTVVTPFNSQEVQVLKQLVETVLTKKTNTPSTPVPKKESRLKFGPADDAASVQEAKSKVSAPPPKANEAQLMSLENIDITYRNKLQPMSVVRVLETKEGMAFVQDFSKGIRFWVPSEDLDFNYQNGG